MSGIPTTAVSSARILVVDDTPANLRLMRRLLAGHGHTVHVANSGETALQFMQSTVPDIVLLDVMMPGIDGYEVCRQMKADARLDDVPVIFISALDAAWDKVKAFAVGGMDYVVKPIDETEMLARLGTHLSLHSLKRDLELRVQERTAALLKAKEALRENQKLLKAIIDTSATVITVKDLDGCYLLANERFHELFAGDGEDLHGHTDQEIFPADVAATLREMDRRVIDSGEAIEAEVTLPHGGEQHIYISVNSPLRDLNGRIHAVCCIATDITERVREEATLRELNEMLEARLAGNLKVPPA
jgi:PAS domain S-box-containing protein